MMQLADTNIVSELMRKRPDPGVLAWREMVDAMYGHITMSAVTVLRRPTAATTTSAWRV